LNSISFKLGLKRSKANNEFLVVLVVVEPVIQGFKVFVAWSFMVVVVVVIKVVVEVEQQIVEQQGFQYW
jgi:hypothetical protein